MGNVRTQINSDKVRGILLFKLRYIGDVVLTTPSIRLLRNAFRTAHITMVVNKGTEQVIIHNPFLNQVLTVDNTQGLRNVITILKEIKRHSYDIAIDFASGDRAAWLALWSGAGLRIGLASNEGFRRWLNNIQVHWSGDLHMVELYLKLVCQVPGLLTHNIEPSDNRLEVFMSPSDIEFARSLLDKKGYLNKRFIIVHASCRYNQNSWPNWQWQKLLNNLAVNVVFVGKAQDDLIIKSIQAGLEIPSVSLAGETTILQTCALMQLSKGFIGYDSGPMHLAAAMGIPIVAIFGPKSDPIAWRPWTPTYLIIYTHQSIEQILPQVRSFLGV